MKDFSSEIDEVLPQGPTEAGNIDLNNRPKVKNPDGSISTVRSLSFNQGGDEILVPTVSDDGRIMSNDEAIQQYNKTGKHLGKFSSIEAANAYADSLHKQQQEKYLENDFSSEIDEVAGTNTQLRANLYSSTGIAPEQATKQYQLSKQTNIPINVVRARENDIKQMTEFNSIDFANLESEFPKLSEQLRDPAKGPAIRDDISKLSYFERLTKDFKQSYETGLATRDIGEIEAKNLFGLEITPEEQNTLALAKGRATQDYKIGFVPGIPGAIVEMAPPLIKAIKDAAIVGTAGAAIGGAAGAVIGGPVGAAPGAIAGFTATFSPALAVKFGVQEAGNAFSEYKDIKDLNGKPLDPDVARGAAMATGIVNGVLEKTGIGIIAKQFPGVDKLLSAVSRNGVREIIKKGTSTEIFKRIGKATLIAGAGEGATEFVQEVSTTIFGEISKAVSSGNYEVLGMKNIEDIDGFWNFIVTGFERAAKVGLRAMQGGAGLGASGAGISIATEAKQNKDQNAKDQAIISDVVKNTKESKVFGRDPKLFEEVTADTLGQENVHIAAEDVKKFFQSDEELNKFFEAMPEAAQQMQEALETGGNLVLPANKVASLLASGQGFEGLQKFMKLNPDSVSDEEFNDIFYERIVPGVNDQEQSNNFTKSDEIQQKLETQISAAGFTPETSKLYTTALKSFYDTQAQRLGNNPEAIAELDKAFDNLEIKKTDSTLEDNIQEPDALDDLIEKAKKEKFLGKKIKTKDKGLDAFVKDLDAMGMNIGHIPTADIKRIIKDYLPSPKTYNQSIEKLKDSNKPAFYSALEKSITDLPQGKGSSEQWAGIIKNLNQKGVKQEEIEWTGIQDWLKEQKGNVTKEQVLDYLKANQIKVEEVVKGESDMSEAEWLDNTNAKVEYDEENDEWIASYEIGDEQGELGRWDSEEQAWDGLKEEAQNQLREYATKENTKFQKYTLPGGENYRELLMTLPEKENKRRRAILNELSALEVSNENSEIISQKRKTLKEELSQQAELKSYKSSHYDEPNILAHIRFNERTDKDGKRVMFIEEVQSDWHQDGKKRGYKKLEPAFKITLNGNELRSSYKTKEFAEEAAKKLKETNPEGKYEVVDSEAIETGSVPNAPFKTTWPELSFKRALMWAVENNFDKVAWTTGEQQAERYDLSKAVQEIYYTEDGRLIVIDKEGEEIIEKEVPEDKIEDYIGKEAAKKLIEATADNDGSKRLANMDLKVGGEGMKGFYDKMLPSMVNKLVKKFGGKAEETELKDVGNVHSLEITPEMRNSIGQGLPLFQNEQNPRGSIQFGLPDGKTVINLFKQRNLSTLLHESGHFFLETQKTIANLPNAPEQIKNDWKEILSWLGSKDGEITTEMHEKFARGFEAYLYKGKAPSVALREAFRRFRAWLVRVYKNIKALNVEVSKEMASVFDRMLATDNQIEALKQNPAFKPDPKIMEMLTPEEQGDYLVKSERNVALAKDRLLKKALREKERENKKYFKKEREQLVKETTERLNKAPIYRALHFLKTGELLGEETPADLKPYKMDRKAVKERYGDEVGIIPKDILGDDGVAPEIIAENFGFSSADEMLKGMAKVPNMKAEINRSVDEEMERRYGNMLNDGSLEREAVESMHNQYRASQLGFEADTINTRVKDLVTNQEELKIKASEIIGRKKVDDAIKPAQYYSAEIKASREAGKALGKRDYEAAADWKRKELINHYLFQESLQAREQISRALEKFSKYLEHPKRGKVEIDEEYRQKVVEVLSNYRLAPRNKGERLTLSSLKEWQLKKKAEDDVNFIMVDEAAMPLPKEKHYRDLTMDQFRALNDIVQNIAIQGRDKRSVEIEGVRQELEEVSAKLTESINKNIPKSIKTTPRGQKEKASLSFVKRFGVSLIKARTLIREMDGFKDLGPAHAYIMDNIDSSEVKRVDRLRKSADDVAEIFKKHYGTKETGLPKKLIYISRIEESWTKEAIIAAALNYGNLDSRTKLLEGENLTEGDMEAVLSNLTENDLNFVQDIWNYVNTFWPEKEALDKKRYGIGFTKVEPSAFTVRTKDGKTVNLKGGYYPLKYDYARQKGNESNFIKEPSIDDLFTKSRNYSAQTKRSSSNERVSGVKLPVKLNITPLFEHLNEVITDITMSEAITNSYKIINNKEVRAAIIDKMGNNTYTQLELWLKDLAIAGSRASSAFENSLNFLRSGVTTSVMGFKVATAMMQVNGYTQTFAKLGPKYALKGLAKFLGNGNPLAINKNVHAVFEKSKIMRQRATTFHRDIYEVQKNLEGKGAFKNAFAKAAFWPIVKMQMLVDVPTWLGAYEKGLNKFEGNEDKAVKYADMEVIQAQGSGLMKDQSGFERGTVSSETRLAPLVKLWTVFYSYYNTKLNVAYESLNKTNYKKPKDVARMATDMLLLFWLEAVIGEYLIGRAPDFEDDDKDPLWWNIKLALSNIASTIPGIREISAGMQGFSASPASLRGLESISTASNVVSDTAKKIYSGDDIDIIKVIQGLNSAGGILFKYPSSQINTTLHAIDKANQGEDVAPKDYLIYKK